ncbi:hemerythrin domain-containing protein [Arenicella xantha]|uniref:Hemerythrin HHE cation binding domain-containing protein n=1 Tax=Arenicella xantha TaxID=644221 RepID=A0A395JKW9_9GAMM|nr:hemerythrin domain-containing protein [Arenicella xantha]RBP51351.1 hemerythrin HHE cation binding domain-containing protein [Arenicella xantha]
MFDFVGKFFKGRPDKKQQIAAANQRATALKQKAAKQSRGIGFDAGLIDNLEKDHEQLVEIFGKIWKDGFEAGNFEVLTTSLSEFKTLFQSHLLKENVKFYAYLEQSMRQDPHSLSVVREFRRDMNDIANAVISFCRKYERPEYTKVAKESFKKEYQGIGQALVRRVQLEERDLYSLYAPS